MRRINFHLSDPQFAVLQRLTQETGLTMAEILRRALDAYVQQWQQRQRETQQPATKP
jgi:hypothetical protein